MNSAHPDLELMLRFEDQDLPVEESRAVEQHFAECDTCRGELDSLRQTLGRVDEFCRTMHAAWPGPPRPWGEPRWCALAPAGPPRRVLAFPVRRGLAAAAGVAAAVLAGIVLVRWMEQPRAVSAAELLRKATASEQQSPRVQRRIRMASRAHSWTRPARLGPDAAPDGGDAAALTELLRSAGYPWEDPLSAAAFSEWRDRLPEKQDEVRNAGDAYVITTSTPAGALAEASLTLRSGDLHAVRATLRYRSDETIDISEVETGPESGGAAPAPTAVPLRTRPPTVAAPAGPADEIRVVAALHRIGADLGDPIAITLDQGGIAVVGTGLSASRQEQIRAALAGIPGLHLTFEGAGGRRLSAAELPRGRSAVANAANPLLDELRAAAGNPPDDPGDALIDAADRALQGAHALNRLGLQFPLAVEAQLSAEDQGVLHQIAEDHVRAMLQATGDIAAMLASVSPPESATPPAAAGFNWQQTSEGLVENAAAVDQEINSSGSDLAGRKARLRTALARLRELGESARSQLQ